MSMNTIRMDCCPFKTTPGKFNGGWTNCIHGLTGRRNEILKELQEIEDQIFLLQVNKTVTKREEPRCAYCGDHALYWNNTRCGPNGCYNCPA